MRAINILLKNNEIKTRYALDCGNGIFLISNSTHFLKYAEFDNSGFFVLIERVRK
jgi:hypothetical protein